MGRWHVLAPGQSAGMYTAILRALGFVLAATAVSQAAGQSVALPLLPGPLPTVYPEILELPEEEFPRRFWVGVGTDFGYDDNVFRLQEGDTTSTVGATGRPNSSWIYRLYAQANLDLRVDRQRFLAQASVSDYGFSGLAYLDYTAPEFRGAWLWQAGDALRGELRYEHLRARRILSTRDRWSRTFTVSTPVRPRPSLR
jgi:hypothetical protein